MKVGDLVKRCPHFWNSADALMTDYERSEIGIIVQFEKSAAWHPGQEYFVVMWKDGLDWRRHESIMVINENR